jgi:diguanylate cyclase (GGDEF)-like protein
MHHPTRLLAYGFIVILMMMVFLAFIAFHSNADSSLFVSNTVTRQLEKIKLVNGISDNVHNSTRFIQSMLLYKDDPNSEMVWENFNQFTATYNDLRLQFADISTAREKESQLAIDSSIEEFTRLNRQTLNIYLNGNREQANKFLLNEVFPKTIQILDNFSSLDRSLRTELNERLLLATGDAESNQTQFVIYAVFTLVISLGIAVFAIWYNQRLSTQLQDINTYLEEKVSERTESLLNTQKELIEDNSELTRLASTDSLTGLSNRSYMNEILEKEYSRYMRHNQLYGIIMLDIDHFKKINDDYGHDIGDKVLIQLSRQLELAVRNSDYISRWGGEEFLICCTTINPNDLLPIAETIRLNIFNTEFDITENITVSLGCAIIQPDEKIKELIKRADVALYAAKNNGRNQTIISEYKEFI